MADRGVKRKNHPDNEEQPTSSKADKDFMFSEPWKGSDAVLIVEEKELHVHTTVLSLASPVFEKMFNGNFVEAQTKRVTLEGKKYDLIDRMLRIIYPSKARLELSFECEGCRNLPRFLFLVDERSICNVETCQKCGCEFYKKDCDRSAILKHLQKLHQLSQEYMIDILAQRIEDHLYLQSLSIQSLNHAFDILETLDIITPSKDCRIQHVRENYARYFEKNLKSLKVLEKAFLDRQLSLESTMMLRGFLLENLMKQIDAGMDPNGDVNRDVYSIASDLQNIGVPW